MAYDAKLNMMTPCGSSTHLHQHVPRDAIAADQAEPPEAARAAPHDGHVAADGFQVDAAVWRDFIASEVLPWQLNFRQLDVLQAAKQRYEQKRGCERTKQQKRKKG
jgi:hypothetical protein